MISVREGCGGQGNVFLLSRTGRMMFICLEFAQTQSQHISPVLINNKKSEMENGLFSGLAVLKDLYDPCHT